MFKRKNPDAPTSETDLDRRLTVDVPNETTPPPANPQPPPLRTFVLRYFDRATSQLADRTIYAHSFECGEDGTLAFVTVFQILNGPLVTAPRYLFNRGAWETVEEIRADYPEMVTH